MLKRKIPVPFLKKIATATFVHKSIPNTELALRLMICEIFRKGFLFYSLSTFTFVEF